MSWTNLDALVMKSQARPDPVVERLARLARGVHIPNLFALHVSPLPVQRRLDDTVPDGLGHNILGRLLASQVQADADVAEGNA